MIGHILFVDVLNWSPNQTLEITCITVISQCLDSRNPSDSCSIVLDSEIVMVTAKAPVTVVNPVPVSPPPPDILHLSVPTEGMRRYN